MKSTILSLVGSILAASLAGCGDPGSSELDPDAGATNDGASDAADDDRPPDPADPVEDVPPYQGAYSFGKLTTEDSSPLGGTGTWFNDDQTEHMVMNERVRYARYRDRTLLQDKHAAQVWIYDHATTTVGDAIELPSDAVGRATVRGGLVFVGGLAKIYSYELATGTWRTRMLAGTGTCHQVVAGKQRLFAMCTNPTQATTQDLFSTWANTTMSDVVPLGGVTPGASTEAAWITAAPGQDVAYFASRSPDPGCIGKATATTLDPCAVPIRTLGTLSSAFVKSAQASEDGASLFVAMFFPSDTAETRLYEVQLATLNVVGIRSIDSYATCPDNAVVFQDFTISQRYAGGVTTDVRLGFGGDADMACPLKPL